jgi:signal transduction histidine kinase
LSSRTVAGIDPDRTLGRALVELLAVRHSDLRPGDANDSVAAILARHALVEEVRGCAICVIDGPEEVRVAGVAGSTGSVGLGSRWPVSRSPVAEVLSGTELLVSVEPRRTQLGRALTAGEHPHLLAAPLRRAGRTEGEPGSLGAVLIVRDDDRPIAEDLRRFLEHFASLVALALPADGVAQDWRERPGHPRGSVADLAGMLDAGDIVPHVLQRALQMLEASRATLLRVDGEDIVVEGTDDVEGRSVAPGARFRIAEQPLLVEALAGAVILGQSLAPSGLPSEESDALADVRHTIVLPLRVRGTTTGFLVVFRRRPRPFIHDDAITLHLLGNVALLALRNSRLFADSQAAAHAMASFLNLVVHDLRAPLTVLSGYIDLLRNGSFGEIPATWERPMTTIAAKVHETHRLVDDILLAARLESGAIPASIEAIDLNDIIDRAAVRSEARALLAGAHIETARQPAPVAAFADVFHVDRIIDNLINNAINYGGRSPWIRLSIDPASPPAVRVEDRGVGINPELHARIFDRFFRIDNDVPGTGFGLHVGRVLAEACGGSLRIERSAPSEGSIFRLELPPASGT